MLTSRTVRSVCGVALSLSATVLSVCVVVSGVGCEAAPARAAEPAEAIIAYKLGDGANKLHKWDVADSKKIADVRLAERIQKVMADPGTYGKTGARCFEPGMAFTMTLDGKRTDAVICLKCSWVYFYDFVDGRPGEKARSVALSDQGVKSLTQLYTEMFGK